MTLSIKKFSKKNKIKTKNDFINSIRDCRITHRQKRSLAKKIKGLWKILKQTLFQQITWYRWDNGQIAMK